MPVEGVKAVRVSLRLTAWVITQVGIDILRRVNPTGSVGQEAGLLQVERRGHISLNVPARTYGDVVLSINQLLTFILAKDTSIGTNTLECPVLTGH